MHFCRVLFEVAAWDVHISMKSEIIFAKAYPQLFLGNRVLCTADLLPVLLSACLLQFSRTPSVQVLS